MRLDHPASVGLLLLLLVLLLLLMLFLLSYLPGDNNHNNKPLHCCSLNLYFCSFFFFLTKRTNGKPSIKCPVSSSKPKSAVYVTWCSSSPSGSVKKRHKLNYSLTLNGVALPHPTQQHPRQDPNSNNTGAQHFPHQLGMCWESSLHTNHLGKNIRIQRKELDNEGTLPPTAHPHPQHVIYSAFDGQFWGRPQ